MAVSNRTSARRIDHPHYASVLEKLRPSRAGMPHHVVLPGVVFNGPAKSPGLTAGYLGAGYDPFIPGADPAAADFRVESVGLPPDVGTHRLADRRALLGRLDRVARRAEQADAAG